MTRCSELGFRRHQREPGGVSWAGSRVGWLAAPSRLLVEARLTARHMAEAGGASTRTAPSPLKAAAGRRTARRMAEASGASTRAAPSLLKAAGRRTARRMAGASGAKRRAASSQLKATRAPARRMAGASGVRQAGASAEGGGVAVASAGAWAGTRANFRIGESMSSIEGGTCHRKPET